MACDFGASGHANGLHFGDIDAMDNPAAYTVSFWIYLDAIDANNQWALGKRQAGNFDGWYLYFKANTGELTVNHYDTAAAAVSSTTGATAATWQHWVMSWDGTNADFYTNGAANGTPAFSKVPDANADNFCIGNNSTYTSGAGGLIHDVKWWNTALDAQEAASVYAGGVPQHDNLVFWWSGDSKASEELLSQITGTVQGTVTDADFTAGRVPRPGWSRLHQDPGTYISYVYKVVDETLGLSESLATLVTQIRVVDESLGVLDHAEEGSGYREPDGTLTETVTSGSRTTVWTKGFPPFTRKTKWTASN